MRFLKNPVSFFDRFLIFSSNFHRALSSGRFAVGTGVDPKNLATVDQEYLFQHIHAMFKKRGSEYQFSGLRNMKYEKFLSRPHVGQKLMVCWEGVGFCPERLVVLNFSVIWPLLTESLPLFPFSPLSLRQRTFWVNTK